MPPRRIYLLILLTPCPFLTSAKNWLLLPTCTISTVMTVTELGQLLYYTLESITTFF